MDCQTQAVTTNRQMMINDGNRHHLTALVANHDYRRLMTLVATQASLRMTLPGLISLALQPQSYLQMERQLEMNKPMSRLGRGTY